jgi:hypothetical protein
MPRLEAPQMLRLEEQALPIYERLAAYAIG